MTSNKAKGFTLIETLVALVLLSIVSIALAGVYRSAFNGHRHTSGVIQLDTGAEMVFGRINKDIQNIVLFSKLRFTGTPDEMSFVALLPTIGRDGTTEICHTAITYCKAPGESSNLLRICSPYCGLRVDTSALTNMADSLIFSYGMIDENGTLIWTDSWNSDGNPGLPTAVRVELRLSQTIHEKGYSRNVDRTIFLNVADRKESELDEVIE